MRPTLYRAQAAINPAAAMPKTMPPPRLVPALVFGAAGSLVVYYIGSQLHRTSSEFDRSFAKYNTPESEASRARTFAGLETADPRTSVFNALGWKN